MNGFSADERIADLETQLTEINRTLAQIRLDIDYAISIGSQANQKANQLKDQEHRRREERMRGLRQ